MYHSFPDIYHHWKLKKGHCINIHVRLSFHVNHNKQFGLFIECLTAMIFTTEIIQYICLENGRLRKLTSSAVFGGGESVHKGRIIYFHFDWSLNFKWKNPYLHKSWFELSGYCQLANPTFESKPQGEMSFSGENVSIYVLSHGTL